MTILSKVNELVEELNQLNLELEEMSAGWLGNNECDAALSDPGLQYEKENELESKFKELRDLLVDNLR